MFSRYAWVVSVKNKKDINIVNASQSILQRSNGKQNKIWVDHGSECYNLKTLKKNDTEMYSTFNEGKSIIAERFIKTLKNKIYRHMTSVGKNVYFNVLGDIVKEYNSSYHSLIKMKPKDVTDSVFIWYNEEVNEKA